MKERTYCSTICLEEEEISVTPQSVYVASEAECLVFSTMKSVILLPSFLVLQHCHAKQVDVCYVCLE